MINKNKIWLQLLLTLLILISATLLSFLIKTLGFSDTNMVVIYILSVLIVSYMTQGFLFGIVASVVSMFSFNFFFTPPIHTFNVYNKSYILTFAVMLMASILTSTLTSKIMHSSEIANMNKKQFQTLYKISSALAKASSASDVANISVKCLSNLLDCDVTYITTIDNINYEYSIKKKQHSVSMKNITKEQIDIITQNKYIYSIKNQANQYGLVCLPNNCILNKDEKSTLLYSITNQIFVAMERERLYQEKRNAKNEIEQEKFKNNLLRAISHDIRGPLSSISGSAEVLLYNTKDEENLEFVRGIYDSSIWLTQMVENILSLTKVQEGSLNLNKKNEAVEEIIGVVLRYFSKYSSEYKVMVEIPDDVIFVPMDGKLISQVLINLVDNAIKHSDVQEKIIIKVTVEKTQVWFSVIDKGTGIKPKHLHKVFDLFFISDELPVDTNRRGNGLGLSICKAIVLAHGGKIFAENNQGKGATFRFSLPL